MRQPDDHSRVPRPHAVPDVRGDGPDENLASRELPVCPDLSFPRALEVLAVANHEALGRELGEALANGMEAHCNFTLEGQDAREVVFVRDALVPILFDPDVG